MKSISPSPILDRNMAPDPEGLIEFSADYFKRLSSVIQTLDLAQFARAIEIIERKWKEQKQIIAFGNGGSALTALHFITDWNKAIFKSHGRPFRGRSLLDNIGLLTALGNDISFQDIFVEQLRNVATPGDLIVAVSGSGNSENVIRAVDYANDIGCETIGLVGFSGGRLKERVSQAVWAPVNDMQLCEDIHSIFGHMVMQKLCHLTAEQRLDV
jgi:D-sedoheptulose 7-phosphate isomerase